MIISVDCVYCGTQRLFLYHQEPYFRFHHQEHYFFIYQWLLRNVQRKKRYSEGAQPRLKEAYFHYIIFFWPRKSACLYLIIKKTQRNDYLGYTMAAATQPAPRNKGPNDPFFSVSRWPRRACRPRSRMDRIFWTTVFEVHAARWARKGAEA